MNTPLNHKPKIAILGGGIAGLNLAYRIQRWAIEKNKSLDITLIEANQRLGGIIETDYRDGFLLEKGPDAFFTEKPWALDLVHELELTEELIETNLSKAQSYIYCDSTFHPTPKGLHLITPTQTQPLLQSKLLSWPGKIRMLAEKWIPATQCQSEESVADFIRRRFGTEAYIKIGQPMLGGIHSGDPEELCIQETFPKLVALEKQHGSLIRGLQKQFKTDGQGDQTSGPRYGMFLSFKQGMQTFTDRLVKSSPHVDFRIGTLVKDIQFSGQWKIITENETLHADYLCSALPSSAAQGVFSSYFPELGQSLDTIPTESVATLNLAYKQDQVDLPPGFGFVVPSTEKKRTIGCSFSSTKFSGRAPQNQVLIRVFAGGAFNRKLLNQSPHEIQTQVLKEITSILKIKGDPLFSDLSLYHDAMPQYHLGHRKLISDVHLAAQQCSNLWFTGNIFSGVGIPDVIAHSNQIANKITKALDQQFAQAGQDQSA